jgi:hypothetical protein
VTLTPLRGAPVEASVTMPDAQTGAMTSGADVVVIELDDELCRGIQGEGGGGLHLQLSGYMTPQRDAPWKWKTKKPWATARTN